MIHIELTDHETELLHDIVAYYLSELRMEIAGTDQLAFRENLKGKEQEINKILTTLAQVSDSQSTNEKATA
ncbi:MAG: hypothetical protein R2867_13740 [Caldilineaceae bacterium]